jgi:ribosomal protein L15
MCDSVCLLFFFFFNTLDQSNVGEIGWFNTGDPNTRGEWHDTEAFRGSFERMKWIETAHRAGTGQDRAGRGRAGPKFHTNVIEKNQQHPKSRTYGLGKVRTTSGSGYNPQNRVFVRFELVQAQLSGSSEEYQSLH